MKNNQNFQRTKAVNQGPHLKAGILKKFKGFDWKQLVGLREEHCVFSLKFSKLVMCLFRIFTIPKTLISQNNHLFLVEHVTVIFSDNLQIQPLSQVCCL